MSQLSRLYALDSKATTIIGFFLSCFFHHHPPWHTQDFRSPSGSKAKSLVEPNIALFICFQIKRPFAVDTTNEPQQSTPYPLPLPLPVNHQRAQMPVRRAGVDFGPGAQPNHRAQPAQDAV